MNERGCFTIEARWEQTHESPTLSTFYLIEQIGGSLDEAKSITQTYFRRHVAASSSCLEWVEGVYEKSRCWYAHTGPITFRITA